MWSAPVTLGGGWMTTNGVIDGIAREPAPSGANTSAASQAARTLASTSVGR